MKRFQGIFTAKRHFLIFILYMSLFIAQVNKDQFGVAHEIQNPFHER